MKQILLVLVLAAGCGGGGSRSDAPTPARPREVTRNTVDLTDPAARTAGLRAIETYRAAARSLYSDLRALDRSAIFDHQRSRAMWEQFLAGIDATDRWLVQAARDPNFALETCLACVEEDWNGTGEIDAADRHLLEVETDVTGAALPETDPRRRPTFRFDHGDLLWARGMLAFQRAGIELILAYEWSALANLEALLERQAPLHIKLVDKAGVARAKASLIAALDLAVQTQAAYLAETDDDREWVPNPDQRDHPIQLRVDPALYATWAGIVGDVRKLLTSEEGIPLKGAGDLLDDDVGALMPDAYLDLGAMLAQPQDIVLDLRGLPEREREWTPLHVRTLLSGVVGAGLKDRMRETQLIDRLDRMKSELMRGADTFDQKLRYLFWLN